MLCKISISSFISVITIVVTLLSLSVKASSPRQLTIFTEHFQPYNFIKDGQVVGINTELVRLACRDANIECQFKLLPWTRAFHLTQTTKLSGLISTSRYAEREKLFKWVGPLVSGESYVYKLLSRNDIEVNHINDLKSYTIGLQRNDVYESVLTELGFEEGRNLLYFSLKHQDAGLFINKKLDLIIGSSITIPYQLSSAGIESNIVEPILKLPIPQLAGNYLALNREIPDEYVKRLQQALNRIENTAIKQVLIRKYQLALENKQ